MIDFNIPPHTGAEEQYIQEAIEKRKLCGDGMFTRRCMRGYIKINHGKYYNIVVEIGQK